MTSDGYTFYCIYDAGGSILSTGVCLATDLLLQKAPSACAVMTCDPDVRSNTHKIDLSGETPTVVELTNGEKAALVAKIVAMTTPPT